MTPLLSISYLTDGELILLCLYGILVALAAGLITYLYLYWKHRP